MILSSRQIRPTMALRRTASSQAIPTNATFAPSKYDLSAKHGITHLLDSPLPSPALPSILPRHGKKPTPYHYRACLRIFLRWSLRACGLGLAYWLILAMIRTASPPATVRCVAVDADTYMMTGEDPIPDAPAAVAVIDGSGIPKWTISIPSADPQPLRPSQYAAICRQSELVSKQLQESKVFRSHPSTGSHDYDHVDPNFMDVAEAEQLGLLRGAKPVEPKSEKDEPTAGGKFCTKSLTYVMESVDAGFGMTLMGLWASYGLAKVEGRAFFVDDTNWAYGKYTTFFRPAPVPSCLPPPPHHRVPCPHQARHLVVSASTAPWTFGAAFERKFQDQSKSDDLRQKPLFTLLRAGHDALFHLSEPDSQYARTRVAELVSHDPLKDGLTVGVHVRHGDRHPLEYQYEKSYIPLESYMRVAQDMIALASKNLAATGEKTIPVWEIILASDDPDVYDAPELQPAVRAQSQILLASKRTLDAAQGSSASSDKFSGGNIGWEGGFFSNMFWNLGGPSDRVSAVRDVGDERDPPNENAMRMREFLGRAYLLDLKLVSSADGVVCGVSSIGCRLLAVMMGWERAIVGRGWRNVDGGFGWRAFHEDSMGTG